MRRSSCLWQLQTPGDAIYPRTPPRRVLQASIPELSHTAQCVLWFGDLLPISSSSIYISLTFQMQTVSFKVIDSICWVVPLRYIMFQFGPYILSFTFHPSSSGFSLPPTLRKTVPSSRPYSQASNVTSTRFLWLMLLAGVDFRFTTQPLQDLPLSSCTS